MQRVGVEGPRARRRDEWLGGVRVASIAAAVAALLLVASLPFGGGPPPESAEASEITEEIRAAAQALDTYRASFSIVERGWNEDVGVRRFSARVWFDAPEEFRLQVRDLTTYPDDRWPENDVDLVANARRWWIAEPSTCPSEALPSCAVSEGSEERTVVQRQPFDGTSTLPTDIIVPLETLASSGDFSVLGRETVAGRSTIKVALPTGRRSHSWARFSRVDCGAAFIPWIESRYGSTTRPGSRSATRSSPTLPQSGRCGPSSRAWMTGAVSDS